jgi:hypothetical protein
MDRQEFDRHFGEKKALTVIFLPHARAKFRKLKISHRLLAAVLVLITSSLLLSTFFTYMYLVTLRDEAYMHQASTAALEKELADANTQVAASFRHLDLLTRKLVREQRDREEELRKAEKRYEELRGLTAGQEEIAEKYRSILERRSLAARMAELSLGFLVGVLSSLTAAAVLALRRSPPVSATEAEELRQTLENKDDK